MENNVTAFRLCQKVSVGDKFRIRYLTPINPSHPQFAINLIDDIRNNIILNFNPRYIENDVNNNKKLVLNNCINGKWQKEVWYNVTEDFRGEKEMTIEAQHHAFVITAADGMIYEFPVRMSVAECSKIEITMGGSFKSLVHQKPAVDYYANDLDFKK